MPNELTPQEIAEHLEKIHPKNALAMDTIYQLEALKEAAAVLRRYANGELRPVVHCGECKKSAKCYIKGVFPYPEYCSVGERKDGTE